MTCGFCLSEMAWFGLLSKGLAVGMLPPRLLSGVGHLGPQRFASRPVLMSVSSTRLPFSGLSGSVLAVPSFGQTPQIRDDEPSKTKDRLQMRKHVENGCVERRRPLAERASHWRLTADQ
ncbi:hypothetical protein HRR90_009078 [Exophiala dermatitidis]|uniref:Uncharacterized protein n=1 Tax=Exophiala dermatitidis TaxID=5970 RepID=A0AAN6F0L1_EXODE|nr:hypothetical protein HRR74_003896 [Exophiala dermatitidis]KAJ4537446.1 hypothetical protein HRR76_005448 [Exophiala dermatitidis]KAJ4551887.1 hypothetical protein HRR77_003109 [Exophiala dermatitidis]KAJ4561490.1 hypothetical protein HRR81_009455 [Exophiala dermatitidis]KAJ4569622.1 hypothetical protein HRR79_004463 [Exophiala dermatitidis]